jgi:DNA-binding transcriptional LysR family regulator
MELRHLRYFTAVVQWKGYREASRRLHIAQPAISTTINNLEEELGVKLLARAKRVAQLTPEGEVFYPEAVRTLAQAESAIETAKRAAKGEIGNLRIGFLGSATSAFLPELVRKFKAIFPGVKLTLQELSPVQQDEAFDKNLIDIGFTRSLTSERSKTFDSRVLYVDPLMAVLPRSKRINTKRVRIADLANERFVLFHRDGSPGVFDTITGLCMKAGFSPRVEDEPNMMQTGCRSSKQNKELLSFPPVYADSGLAILTSIACSLMTCVLSSLSPGRSRVRRLCFARLSN